MLTSKKDTLAKFCILDFMSFRGAIPLFNGVFFGQGNTWEMIFCGKDNLWGTYAPLRTPMAAYGLDICCIRKIHIDDHPSEKVWVQHELFD